MSIKSVIYSSGSFVPDKVITNEELEKIPLKFSSLIEQKTGVKARRFASNSQCTSDLGIIAAKKCLSKKMFDPKNLNAIILATSSPDRIQPASATRIQHAIGATNAFAFDINSVCSGAIYSLSVADSLIKTGFCQNILVVASEIYSKYLDHADFSTYPYFGDGAGAVLLVGKENSDNGILHSILKTDGSKADIIQVPAGGTMLPFSQLTNPKDIYFKMVGRAVYDFAIEKGSEVINDILNDLNINKDNISYIIPHQANINIIKEIASRLKIDLSKFVITLDKYGNTAGASILITLDELIDSGKAKNADLILLVAFGGGLSWGATLINY